MNLYEQEIIELTNLLLNDEENNDIKNILINSGFRINKIVLVSFIEDEEENEYGVIVTEDKRIIEYKRSTIVGQNNKKYFTSKDITDNEETITLYPQVQVALEMIDNRDILW
jgi:autonomous glycyl radical cofactor GrcA